MRSFPQHRPAVRANVMNPLRSGLQDFTNKRNVSACCSPNADFQKVARVARELDQRNRLIGMNLRLLFSLGMLDQLDDREDNDRGNNRRGDDNNPKENQPSEPATQCASPIRQSVQPAAEAKTEWNVSFNCPSDRSCSSSTSWNARYFFVPRSPLCRVDDALVAPICFKL